MSDADGDGDGVGEEERQAIARNVAELRHKRGMTQSDLARASGLVQQKVSAIELGTENVTVRTLARVAQALGVEAATLLRRAPKK